MRDYGKTTPRFFTGTTGRRMRGRHDLQALAHYLIACGSATMTGLYYIPMQTIAFELGMSVQKVRGGLAWFEKKGKGDGFAYYDAELGLVFVQNMAATQIGDELHKTDKRIKGVVREVSRYGDHRFVRMFWERYAAAYHLPRRGQEAAEEEGEAAARKPRERRQAADDYPPEFERFWAVTNQRGSKYEACRAWVRRKRPDVNMLIEKWAEWKRCPQWKKDGGEFQNAPQKWISGRMYEQQPPGTEKRRPTQPAPSTSARCEFHRKRENRKKTAPKMDKACDDCVSLSPWPERGGDPSTAGEVVKGMGMA